MPQPEESKVINISITPGIVFKTILMLVLFYVLYLVRDIVLVVLTSVVIASAIEPFTLFLMKIKIKRLPAVILIYVVAALFLAAIFYYFAPPFFSDLSNFLNSLPQYIENVGAWDPLGNAISNNGGNVVNSITGSFSLADIFSKISLALSNLSSGFVNTLSFIFGGIVGFILIVVLSFYLAVQQDGVGKFLRIVTPLKNEKYIIDLWGRSQMKIGKWMQGQIVLSLVVGVLVYLGLMLLAVKLPGIENPFTFAILAAVLELIPLFGPIISAIPPTLIAFAGGGLVPGLFVIGLYLLIHQFENHLIYPVVVRKIVGVPPILVILALIIGFELGGFLGLILSVPLASVLTEYLDDIQKFKGERRARSEGVLQND